eukprot:jgi/Tetstr1/431900/TSEL_021389.t1
MARRVPPHSVRGGPMSVSFYSVSFLLFLLPLLALVAVGRKKHARAKSHARAKAKAAAMASFAQGRRKPADDGHGSYNQWSEEDMEFALTELVEVACQATKAAAKSAARQTHTAVDKAVTWCQLAAGKLPAYSEALVAALQTIAYVDSAEEELVRLEGAAVGM